LTRNLNFFPKKKNKRKQNKKAQGCHTLPQRSTERERHYPQKRSYTACTCFNIVY